MPNEQIKIEGTVLALIYKNDESGYAVARVMLDDGSQLTIVGIMPYLGAGERIEAIGALVNHPQHGSQLSVQSYERQMPRGRVGIYEYLASRVIKGVGPKTARAIVDRFGDETFEVMAERPELLQQIRGVTPARAREISQSFLRVSAMRSLVEFLARYDLPVYFSAGLLNLWGENAVVMLEKNPYILCSEQFGLPFGRADELAAELGIDEQSPIRLDAAILYELRFNMQNGHAFIPEDKLLPITAQLCGQDTAPAIAQRLEALRDRGDVVCDPVGDRVACYLGPVYQCECFLADEVRRLREMHIEPPHDLQRRIRRQEKERGIRYAEGQKQAMCLCFESGISLITGGPGTGKTTALLTMIDLIEGAGLRASLCAPTGRAAKRMSELTGRESKTLHRLLEAGFDPESGLLRFKRNQQNPLETDVVIVDESSMLDLMLAASLLRAMKPHTRLVLVGDADQLPPVGPGSFFADLLASECVPAVRLTEIFRQAQGSDIVISAHRINHGQMPDLRKNSGDFYFTTVRSDDAAVRTISSLITERIPNYFGIDPADIQVICPSRQMACGTENLNRVLQQALNPPGAGRPEARFGPVVFRLGDRVMQVRNNYDLLWRRLDPPEVGSGVYNGDAGQIVMVDPQARVLTVRFEDRDADYSFDELAQLEHAYAVTAHKSQGSEYPAVILPVFRAPERLLNRSLFYTAVTRARQLLVLVGSEATVEKMVLSDKKTRRYSALRRRIRQRCGDD